MAVKTVVCTLAATGLCIYSSKLKQNKHLYVMYPTHRQVTGMWTPYRKADELTIKHKSRGYPQIQFGGTLGCSLKIFREI